MVRRILLSALSLFFGAFPLMAGPGRIILPVDSVVLETSNEAIIPVRREGGADGEVRVTYNTTGGSAIQGADFLASFGTLIWGDQDDDDKEIRVTIQNDSIVEDGESFTTRLVTSQGAEIEGRRHHITTIASEDIPVFGLTKNFSIQVSEIGRINSNPTQAPDLLRVAWVLESGPPRSALIHEPSHLSSNVQFLQPGEYVIAFFAGMERFPKQRIGTVTANVSGFGFVGDLEDPSKTIFNPIRGEQAEFRGNLATPGILQIRIFDRFGNEIIQVANESLPEGPYQRGWTGEDARGGTVAPGTYLANIREAGQTRSLKVVVLK